MKKRVVYNRISTGIPKFDKILEGGYLKGSAILLVGAPRMGKSLFATHFVTASNEDLGVYITTSDLGVNVVKKITSFKKEFKSFKVIDAYSSTFKKKERNIINVGKSNLSDISVALSEIWKSYPKKTLRCVIDSVSNLLIHNSVDDVANFLEDVISKFRDKGGVLLLIVEEGMHDDKVYVMLEALTDSTIELEKKSEGSFFMFRGFNVENEKVLEFVPYKITCKGVELK
mgnify:CR=1 FL=1